MEYHWKLDAKRVDGSADPVLIASRSSTMIWPTAAGRQESGPLSESRGTMTS